MFDMRSDTSIEKISNFTYSTTDFFISNRNFVILKKFENNILYITRITFDKTDFLLEINYLNLDDSKKSQQLISLEKERLNIGKNFNLEMFIYDFHLEMAFKIFKENYDFNIEVNYIHFLGFLSNNYKHLISNDFYLNAAIITYYPENIFPKTAKDFIDFLKEFASNYGFFCKEIKGVKNLMCYTALDYVNLKEIELYDHDFIIAFDSIEAEQKKSCYNRLEQVVLRGNETFKEEF